MTTEGKGPIVIPCYLVDGVPYVLEVDAAGKLAVRAAEIETLLGAGLPSALSTDALKVREQATLTVQAAGGDKPFSLESIVAEDKLTDPLAAGYVVIDSTAVPTGKLWIITHITWLYFGTPPVKVRISTVIADVEGNLSEWRSVLSDQFYGYNCQLYLPAGGFIRVSFANATLNDAARLNIRGYQMDAP